MLEKLVYDAIAYPLLFILPAYVANGAPVIFGGGVPLDFGMTFRKKRIFGDHKTIRGLIAGILGGTAIAAIESVFMPFMLLSGIAMSFGAHAGDLLGSFLKRQANLKEGSNLPVADQYLFFVFALLFALPFDHFPDLLGIIFLTAITGLLHLYTNRTAYKLKLKKVPW